ncbi:MAG: RNA 2',3'-cyclic phosphodiesterase, partial [Actinomycetia bacterium]|nr:RNA 2',3'-cyclic phosphodiesterase [Actinomycetes bacterium]
MRVFAALVPPLSVVQDLSEFLSPRRDDPAARELSWSRPDAWHITLAFMGQARPDAVDSFIERLAEGGLAEAPLTLQIRGGGAFPMVERAKVLYAAVETRTGDLARLSERTRMAAAVTGCSPDGRAFVPHLTLARSRRATEASRWVRVLDTYTGPTWTADEVAVLESHLGSGRPRYAVLETIPLGHLERPPGP